MTTGPRILVRATNWLGDAIMSLPALQALREAQPRASITVMGFAWVRELYRGEAFLDDFIEYPAVRGLRDVAAKWVLARRLRAMKFDMAVSMQNAFEAALIARLAGIPKRAGYDRDGRGWLLTDAIALPDMAERHERFYYLELLKRAGLIQSYDPDAPVRLRSIERPAASRNVIGVSPGAAFGSAKRWAPERFAAAAEIVARERNASVALFGSAAEVDLVRGVEELLRKAGISVVNHAGKTTLRRFIELCAQCDLMLTNDSGAMHVAYAVGTPSVTVFGSTDHIGTGPVGNDARIVREPVECSPCKLRECPIDHRCMERIASDRVALVALDLLK